MALKTNERPGTRSQVRYARMSASKVRVVLDLIRGKHVAEATQILGFSQRRAAKVIDKCLRAAVANAGHNDDVQPEELYVSTCFADEGPTLKRYRPRARGRAGRIHKQTCHITIVVSRYRDDELDELRRRSEQRSAGGARTADARADRRRRVAGSRAGAKPDDTAGSKPDDTAGTVDDTAAGVKSEDTAGSKLDDTAGAKAGDTAGGAVSDTVDDRDAAAGEQAETSEETD
jgi:large subunit ribosomal protein L22